MGNDLKSQILSIIAMRERHWDDHPIVAAKAILPTPAVLVVHALTKKTARRHRSSIGFFANPQSGKSSCIVMLQNQLPKDYPGCGILCYEAKKGVMMFEGMFLEDLLVSANYEPKILRTLAGKRKQVFRALYALASPKKHLFIIIDEAQEITENILCWLKTVINWLVSQDVRTTVVLFGQRELLDLRDELVASGRSDLNIRYTSQIFEFGNIQSKEEMAKVLAAVDTQSEYPPNSGWPYTQFLFPRAYSNNFRLEPLAADLWGCFVQLSPLTKGASGISMQWIARALAELADLNRGRDSEDFKLTVDELKAAIEGSGYFDRHPGPIIKNTVR